LAESKKAGAANKDSVFGSSVTGKDQFGRQKDSLIKTAGEVTKKKNECTAFGLQALVNARAAAEKAKAIADSCKPSPPDSNGNGGKDCSEEKAAAEAAAQKVVDIEVALREKCQEPLDELIAKLGVTADDAARAEAQARKVKELSAANSLASGGGGGGGGSTKPDNSVDCNKEPKAWEKPACDAHFLKVCKPNSDEDLCQNFATRYCGLDYAPQYKRPNTNADYCKKAQPYYFCKMSPEYSTCLTCKDLQSTLDGMPVYRSTDELAENYKTCENDPMFLDPMILAIVKNHKPTNSTSYSIQTLPPGKK
jgi:hypothetical protein